MVVPKVTVVALVAFSQALAPHAQVVFVVLSLVLLNPHAFDVVPLFTLLAFHHQRVLIQNPIPANAVRPWVLDHQLQVAAVQKLLDSLQRLSFFFVVLLLKLYLFVVWTVVFAGSVVRMRGFYRFALLAF
jgi:hypothetical protein